MVFLHPFHHLHSQFASNSFVIHHHVASHFSFREHMSFTFLFIVLQAACFEFGNPTKTTLVASKPFHFGLTCLPQQVWLKNFPRRCKQRGFVHMDRSSHLEIAKANDNSFSSLSSKIFFFLGDIGGFNHSLLKGWPKYQFTVPCSFFISDQIVTSFSLWIKPSIASFSWM